MTEVRYPNGFKRTVDESEVVDPIVSSEGDPIVNELYRNWVSTGEPELSWETIQKVVETCKRLMPSLSNVVMANDQLSEYSNALIDEMLYFILNGKHNTMSVVSLMPLINVNDPIEHRTTEQKKAREEMYFKIKRETKHPSDYIGLWLSHCGGVEDIVCTLYVLFGGKRI